MRALSIVMALAFIGACGSSNHNTSKQDAGVAVDAAAAGPDASCFTNPTTNDEIINACTTAQKIYLHPDLPLLGSDGSLPPLP
jgi:hypothetical protein